MKKVILLGLITCLLSGCSTAEKKSPVEGAWRLAHEYIKSGDRVDIFPENITGGEIKVWTGSTFVFVGRFKQDSVYTNSYGGGTYKLDGNRYEEEVQYHAAEEYRGKKVKILLEIKNDTLIQTYPVNDNWQADPERYSVEKWVRIK